MSHHGGSHCSNFYDCAFRSEITKEHSESSLFTVWCIDGKNNLRVFDLGISNILAECFERYGRAIQVEYAGFL